MTDITELAQSLKAAAEKATPGPWGVARDGKTLVSNQSHPIATVSDAMHRMLADGSTGKDAEFIALANPANIRALVEALEKAQQSIDSQREYYEGVIADGGKRIAELESCVSNLKVNRPVVYGDGFHEGYWKARSEQSMSSEDENHG
nr:ead/Ea22-like family protein [Klebsiella michiganensis]